MKVKVCLYLLLQFFPLTVALAQAEWCYINFEIIPENPTTNDNLKVRTTTVTPNSSIVISYNYDLRNDTIKIKACYFMSPTHAVITYIDSISLGRLPAGIYHVTFTANLSDLPRQCSPQQTNSKTRQFENLLVSSTPHEAALNIYPNPTSDIVTIDFNTYSDEFALEVTDMYGRLQHKDQFVNKKIVDLSSYAKGIFVFSISNKKRTFLYKVVKQ